MEDEAFLFLLLNKTISPLIKNEVRGPSNYRMRGVHSSVLFCFCLRSLEAFVTN